MGSVKTLVSEIEEDVRNLLEDKGVDFLVNAYQAPKYLSIEELVDFCVGVEYENAFK